MNPSNKYDQQVTRRALFGSSARGLGRIALASLLYPELVGPAHAASTPGQQPRGLPGLPHFAATAKRVIYLFQSGGPSHVDLFDFKQIVLDQHGQELPASIRGDQRVTGMTANQASFPVVAPLAGMARCGDHGTWISDLLPYTQQIANDITIIRSLNTEAINHDPAITFINTGSQQIGHASMGAWLSYGLGSDSDELPAYVVLLSQGTGKNPGQPLFSRLWGSGYLPSSHQGVKLRPGANPVLYLANPPGVTDARRRAMLDDLARLNTIHLEQSGDPEIEARIAAYEMAYRMQSSVPELMDLADEPASTYELYGPERASLVVLPPTACWPDGSRNEGSVLCSSFTGVGINMWPSSDNYRSSAVMWTKPRPG